jgi:hypothetical protein
MMPRLVTTEAGTSSPALRGQGAAQGGENACATRAGASNADG